MTPVEIKAIRERLNLSQAELAMLLGVHFMTVSRWERGKAKPKLLQSMTLMQMRNTGAEGLSADIMEHGVMYALMRAIRPEGL